MIPSHPRGAAVPGLALLLLLAGVLGAGSALGSGPPPDSPGGEVRLHTALEAAYPAEGAELRTPVREIRLRFTTEVQVALSRISVTGPSGEVGAAGPVGRVEGSEGRELRLPLPAPLSPGRYTVEWHSAGPDSHPIQGSYAFRVLAPSRRPDTSEAVPSAVPPAPAPGPRAQGQAAADSGLGADTGGSAGATDTAGGPGPAGAGEAEARPGGAAGLAIHWLFLVSVVGMVGTVAFRLLILPQVARDEALAAAVPRAVRGVWVLAGVAAGLAVLALPARLWQQSVSLFAGDALGLSNLSDLVFRSPWGAGWLVEAACAGIFVVGTVRASPRRESGGTGLGWALMAASALAVAVVPALSGHAWGVEGPRAVAVTSDALHVLAVGVWMGGLGTLVLAGIPAVRAVGGAEAFPRLLPTLVSSFSRIALPAVGLLVASGVTNAWIHLDAAGQLVSTTYGRTLLLKLAVAAGAMALGFYNWRVVRPSLRESPRPGLVRIPATLEFVLGLMVLAVTVFLVSRGLPG